MEFRDLKLQYNKLKTDIDNSVLKVFENSHFISGIEVMELEEELASYIGVKNCITCGNGTDALVLALLAWGIGKGDAVFVPDFTFFASGEAPAFCGATPVFVDVEKDTYNISVKSLEEAVIKVLDDGKLVPRVVIAVDLFGQAADYDRLRKVAKKYNLLVLEDGAQGFGGKNSCQMSCSFGDIGTTSFFPAKPLGCYGDGGAVFTNNDDWADIIRSLCVHGKGINKYDNIRIGMNSRLDTVQAAVLKVKLKAFKEYEIEMVNSIAGLYSELLRDKVITPDIPNGFYSSWAQYTVVCKDRVEREKVKTILKENGIPAMIYYMRGMHEQKAFYGTGLEAVNYINTLYLTERVLSLPIHPYMTLGQVKEIADIIISVK